MAAATVCGVRGVRALVIGLCAVAPLVQAATPPAAPAASAAPAAAPLPADVGAGAEVASLPPASPHWVWVNDFVFPHMADGLAYLVDGDSGRYLGTLSTGYSFARMLLPRDGSVIYSPETYYSRGTRGTRTDVVTVYDGRTLAAQGEIEIPPKRASAMPVMGSATLTDDDRFLLVYNFNPSQSVSVVDATGRKFVGEIETPGCALVFPTGPRSFFSLCADGGLLLVTLDDSGQAAKRERTAPLFDVAHDPVTEKPVRAGDTWYFVSFDGDVRPVRVTADSATAGATWSLTSAAERHQGWRPGGLQQLAVHEGRRRLYAIMHQGSRDTHKDPGKSIWVYDLDTHRCVARLATRRPASSIQLTRDANPLLFSIFMDGNVVDVYDPASGKLLRSIHDVGTSPTLLVTP